MLLAVSCKLIAVGCLLIVAALVSPSTAAALDATEILEKVDDLWRGESSFAEMTMEVATEHYERSMKLKAWSLGKEHSLFIITYPPKDRGVATLKAEQDIWNYLPRVDRTIKIPASLMMGSWMGSHFTNDDLVKESRLVEDYDIVIGFEGVREDTEVWEFVLTPRPEAAVVWGRIDFEVRKDDLMPTWARYYDEDGELVRTLQYDEYQEMGFAATLEKPLPVETLLNLLREVLQTAT